MLTSAADLRVPRAQCARAEAIFALTDGFCLSALDAEYAEICRRLTARLARKRPTPLAAGRAETWAGAVVHAIARLNFLFDASQPRHVSADHIASAFAVAKSTVSAKATHIERLLTLGLFEPDLCAAALVEHHPMAWLVAVEGLVLDARSLPVGLQRAAHEQGLIPFVPGDPARHQAA